MKIKKVTTGEFLLNDFCDPWFYAKRYYVKWVIPDKKKTYQAVDSHQIEETVVLFYRFQCVLNSKRIEKSDNFRLSSVVAFKKLPKRPFYVEWT